MCIPRHHAKGTAIVMAVGLLVLLAMLGAAFVVVTHMDRKEARSLYNAEPMKTVAASVLDKILANRADDMPPLFTATPTAAQSIDYPSAAADKILCSTEPVWNNVTSHYEWSHLSDMGTLGVNAEMFDANSQGAVALSTGQAFPVDCSREKFYFDSATHVRVYSGAYLSPCADALSYDSGMRGTHGHPYYVAVRLVDASAFMNANLAWDWQALVPPTLDPINVTNAPLSYLADSVIKAIPAATWKQLNGGQVPTAPNVVGRVHATRSASGGTTIQNYYAAYGLSPLCFSRITPIGLRPYDASDMLALVGGGSSVSATGRLCDGVQDTNSCPEDNATLYAALRPFLTTWSAGRICTPGRGQTAAAAGPRLKADVNKASLTELHDAFRQMLNDANASVVAADVDLRELTAWQLACNVKDFVDADDVPTSHDATLSSGTKTVVGVERQPVLVEASFAKFQIDASNTETTCALELFNPYSKDLDLADYRLNTYDAAGTTVVLTTAFPAGAKVLAHGRFLIYWCGAVANTKPIQPTPDATKSMDLTSTWGTVDFNTIIRLVRTNVPMTTAQDVIVASVDNAKFDLTAHPLTDGTGYGETIALYDDETLCLYSASDFSPHVDTDSIIEAFAAGPPIAGSLLGQTKTGVVAKPAGLGVPIYIRNGPMVNLADLYRVLTVGPDMAVPPKSLREVLTATDSTRMDRGRLSFVNMTAVSGVPVLPTAALVSDYFTCNSPASDPRAIHGDAQVRTMTSGEGSNTLTDNASPAPWISSTLTGLQVVALDNTGKPVMVCNVTGNGTNTLTLDASLPAAGTISKTYMLGPVQETTYGQINVNTAPRAVLEALVAAIPGASAANVKNIVDEIIQYRDTLAYSNPNIDAVFGTMTGLHPAAGFMTSAEVALPLTGSGNAENLLPSTAATNNQPFGNLQLSDTPTTEDGLALGGGVTRKDLTKYMALYSWLSNLITVRSDVYLAYIQVDTRTDTTATSQVLATRRYVALIDRSNVRQVVDKTVTLDQGSIDSTQASVLADARNWAPGSWVGAKVEILNGPCKGEIRSVVSNTANNLTVDSAWAWTTPPTTLSNVKYRLYFKPNVLFFSAVN